MQGELGPDGFIVIAVNVDHVHADAERFLQEHIPRFGIVFDPDGLLAGKFGVKGIPTSFLIDRRGQIQWKHEGFQLRDRAVLARQIRSLVLRALTWAHGLTAGEGLWQGGPAGYNPALTKRALKTSS